MTGQPQPETLARIDAIDRSLADLAGRFHTIDEQIALLSAAAIALHVRAVLPGAAAVALTWSDQGPHLTPIGYHAADGREIAEPPHDSAAPAVSWNDHLDAAISVYCTNLHEDNQSAWEPFMLWPGHEGRLPESGTFYLRIDHVLDAQDGVDVRRIPEPPALGVPRGCGQDATPVPEPPPIGHPGDHPGGEPGAPALEGGTGHSAHPTGRPQRHAMPNPAGHDFRYARLRQAFAVVRTDERGQVEVVAATRELADAYIAGQGSSEFSSVTPVTVIVSLPEQRTLYQFHGSVPYEPGQPPTRHVEEQAEFPGLGNGAIVPLDGVAHALNDDPLRAQWTVWAAGWDRRQTEEAFNALMDDACRVKDTRVAAFSRFSRGCVVRDRDGRILIRDISQDGAGCWRTGTQVIYDKDVDPATLTLIAPEPGQGTPAPPDPGQPQ